MSEDGEQDAIHARFVLGFLSWDVPEPAPSPSFAEQMALTPTEIACFLFNLGWLCIDGVVPMKFYAACLVSLGLGLSGAPNANAQSPCPPPSTAPSMTIKIFNDEPPGGSYIFPVLSTGGASLRQTLLAWFCTSDPSPYVATKLSRIYINATSGIAPGQSVTLQIPLYTQNTPSTVLPDQYIDWWEGDTIELFFSSSAAPPTALTELVLGVNPDNPNQKALPPVAGLPTCSAGCVLQFFVDTASITKSNPSQLIEFNLGALQVCNNAVTSICKNRPANNQTALDTRNVDFDVSYVNVAFAPAAMAPFNNDQTGFVGTPQTAENFSIAVSKFLASGLGTGWPQFVHTYANKTKETLFKLASPLEIFSRLSPPSTCTAAGTCTWVTPTDLCGLPKANPNDPPTPACSTPTGQLLWPGALWQPIRNLASNWSNHAGSVEAYPNLPQGTCGLNPLAGTFCAAIMDVKQLLIRNYANYVSLMTSKSCVKYIVPMNTFVLLAHVYPWTPFVEPLGEPLGWKQGDPPQPPPGNCTLGAKENLLQNTPIPGGGSYSDNNFALYRQVKLEFDKLNYNLLPPDPTLPYIFNPWVGCSTTSIPNCTNPNGLIHGSNFVNAPNVYAYSVDDAVGNLQSEGTGFIIDVGSSKNLCTGTTPPCQNQSPAAEPININFALKDNPNGDPSIINFTNYGVCQFTPNETIQGLTFKPVNTLSHTFIINARNPQQCPIFLVDNKSPPQLYTFTITQAPKKPPPPFTFFPNGNIPSNVITAAVIDCSGNGNPTGVVPPPPPNPPNTINAAYGQSSQTWCCLKLAPQPPNPTQVQGVFAGTQPGDPAAHATYSNNVNTIEAKKTTSEPVIGTICNMGQ